MMKPMMKKIILTLFLLPTLVLSECTCDVEEDEDINKEEAMKFKIIALISILIASGIGICIPILGRKIPALHPDKNIFFLIKSFAAGVILSTGFIHILPDAFEDLTSPCLNEHPWGDFPFTGFVAMMTALLTLMMDSLATGYYKRSAINDNIKESGNQQVDVHTHATHGHTHGSLPISSSSSSTDKHSSELIRHRVISQVLELGIVVHSVIIGISLGVSQSPSTIKPLIAALSFHQLFEGMGLGSCISQAEFKRRAVVIMVLFFSLTTPVGIGVGIGITNVYSETSPTALIVQGVSNAAAAGILIYMSLVDLLAADFMSQKLQNNGKLQIGAYVSLLVGAGSMSLLAKWA